MTAKKDWKNQERNYRKMIKRLGTEPAPDKKQTVVALWHALGEIYRSRLKDYKSAIAAFEVCVQLDPDATARHQILAELYQLSGPRRYEQGDQGVPPADQGDARDFGQMAATQDAAQAVHGAAPVRQGLVRGAAALAFLRKADAEEMQFYEQYKPQGLHARQGAPDRGAVASIVYHPDEDRYISAIFAAVSQAVAAARAKEHKDWGLKRKDKRDIANDQLLFSKVFNYVNQVLGVPPPEVYLRPESPGEMELANAREKAQLMPSLVVGSSLLQGRPEKELAYVIAKRLTFMRPDHFVRWPHVVPTVAELKIVFLAALKLVQPKFEVKADVAQGVAQYLHAPAALGGAAADRAAGGGRPALRRQQGRGGHPQVGERGRHDRDAHGLPDLQRSGGRHAHRPDRAGVHRRRRSQGEDPRPGALVGLRRVLRAARAPRFADRSGIAENGRAD